MLHVDIKFMDEDQRSSVEQVKQLPSQHIADSDNHHVHGDRDILAKNEIVASRVKDSDPLFFMVKR